MSADPFAWRVHLSEEFAMDALTLHIWREAVPGTVDLITGTKSLERGGYTTERHERGAAHVGLGIVLPRQALEAVAELIKPGPATGEVARLEEALRLERERVDSVLRRLVPRAR